MLSDVEIIQRVKKGKSDVFRELINRHQRKALTLAYRMLGKWDDAEDAVQDAFIRAYRSLHTFSCSKGFFWPWFRKIVINCCLKKFSREVPIDCIETLKDSDQPFVDSIEHDFLRHCNNNAISEAIASLAPDYRSVVVLKYQESLSAPEIAEALNISNGAVRVRLHRALKMLAERLVVIGIEL